MKEPDWEPDWDDDKGMERWINQTLDAAAGEVIGVNDDEFRQLMEEHKEQEPLKKAKEKGDLTLLVSRLEQGIASPAEQAFVALVLRRERKRGREPKSKDERRTGEMIVDEKPFERGEVSIIAEDVKSIEALWKTHFQKENKRARAIQFALRRWTYNETQAENLEEAVIVTLRRASNRSML